MRIIFSAIKVVWLVYIYLIIFITFFINRDSKCNYGVEKINGQLAKGAYQIVAAQNFGEVLNFSKVPVIGQIPKV